MFSFFLTKKDESTQTRLANFLYLIYRKQDDGEYRRLPSGGFTFEHTWHKNFFFDNDLENYPLSEGDLLNIRTERSLFNIDEDDPQPSFFFTFLIELDPL